MKKIVKSLLSKSLPAPAFAALSAISARRFIQKTEHKKGLDLLNLEYIAKHGRGVLRGPFRGMQYSTITDLRHVGARLVGCYEQELSAAVERCCGREYDRVIDVGCAEGYYAVGFALRLPEAEVIAFDTDPWARRACRRLATVNRVANRVRVKGFCSPEKLARCISTGRNLILSDCEGYETILLDPQAVPALAGCDLIVEIHDGPPSMDHPLVERFRHTHRIELVPGAPRTGEEAGQLSGFTLAQRQQLIDELRQPWQGWAVFWAGEMETAG